MKNKNLKKYLLITVVMMVFSYLQFSFAQANIDFKKWSEGARHLLTFLNFMIAFLSSLVFFEREKP